MLLYDNQELLKIMDQSREALRNLKRYEEEKRNDNVTEVILESLYKATKGQEFFEPYDILAWEGKVRVDTLYLEQLLQKLDSNIVESVQEALGKYFKNIRQIYEHINIKPEIYGKGIDLTILELSNDACRQKLSEVIYEFLDKNFYNLTPEMRKEKYEDQARELSKMLIMEGADPDTAITFAVKVAVMENLLTRIAFPFPIWARVKYLMESEDYGKVFDQDVLIELVENFEKKVRSLAKVVAATV